MNKSNPTKPSNTIPNPHRPIKPKNEHPAQNNADKMQPKIGHSIHAPKQPKTWLSIKVHSRTPDLINMQSFNFSKQEDPKRCNKKPKGYDLDSEFKIKHGPAEFLKNGRKNHSVHLNKDIFISKEITACMPKKLTARTQRLSAKRKKNGHEIDLQQQLKTAYTLNHGNYARQPLFSRNSVYTVLPSHRLQDNNNSKHKKTKKVKQEIHNIAKSLPSQVNYELPNMYSMESSLVNSKVGFDAQEHDLCYVIPTEETEEIKEIRQLSKQIKKNGEITSFKNKNKNEDERLCDTESTTKYLIENYVRRLNEDDEIDSVLSKSKDNIGEPERVIQQKQQYQPKQLPPKQPKQHQSDPIHIINQAEYIVKPKQKPTKQHQNKINAKERDNSPQYIINNIYAYIEQNKQKAIPVPIQTPPKVKSKAIKPKEEKEYAKFQDEIQNLTLDILDESLKKHSESLELRREKQIEHLEEIFSRNKITYETLMAEKGTLEKWIQSQLNEVKRARHNIWKSVYQLKGCIKAQESGDSLNSNLNSNSNSKKQRKVQMMMRSLSEKQFAVNKRKTSSQKSRQNHKKRRNVIQTQNESPSHSIIEAYNPSPPNSSSQGDQLIQKSLSNPLKFKESTLKSDKCSPMPTIIPKAYEPEEQKLFSLDTLMKKIDNDSQQALESYGYDAERDDTENGNEDQGIEDIDDLDEYKGFDDIGEDKDIDDDKSIDDIDDDKDLEQGASLQIIDRAQFQQEPGSPLLNSTMLTQQDKQDIFQFIFLDLCIDLFTDQNPESQALKKVNQYLNEIKDLSKKNKGSKFNYSNVKEFLLLFIQSLKNDEEKMHQVYNNLDTPLGPSAEDILHYMHLQQESQNASDTVFILDIKLFDQFEVTYLKSLEFKPSYYLETDREIKRINFLKNATHIHNKAIFDSLNECLDRFRPYGLWGQPFNWKSSSLFLHPRDNQRKNQLLLEAVHKTLQNTAYMCGIMVDKQGSPFKNRSNISQNYVEQVRQERMSHMLALEIVENQEKMLFFDDEETEVMVEISNQVFRLLLIELVEDWKAMKG